MPGFHQHDGKDSYYIVPNFSGDCRTYQVNDHGQDIVLSLGYGDGDLIPRSVFDTLNDLGLLYFKDTDKDPQSTAPDPDAVDFDMVDDLSVDERCTFLERILDAYALSEIRSNAFYRVYHSVESGPTEELQPVLDRVLVNTPFDADITRLALEKRDKPVMASAAYLHHAYDTLRANGGVRTSEFAETFAGELVIERGDYGFYLVDDHIWAAEARAIGVPKPVETKLHDAYDSGGLGNLVQSLSEVLGGLMLGETDSRVAHAVAAGVDSLDGTTLAVLPHGERESATDTETDEETTPTRVPSIRRREQSS